MPWHVRRMSGNRGKVSSFGFSRIYGVSWDGGSSPILTRTDDAGMLLANAGVDSGVVTNDFDNVYPWSQMIEVTDDYGNVFIRIPKFYIEKTAIGSARTWRISGVNFGNAYLPACFANADYVDVGKHNAYLNGTKLESKAGLFPTVNRTIVQFRDDAKANGAGYQQMDIHVIDILQTLFSIEFATLNSQAIMAGFTSGAYVATDTATVAENAANRVIVANAVAAKYVVGQTVGLGTSLGGNEIFSNRVITSITVYDASNKAINVDGATFNVAVGNIIYSLGWKSGFSSSIVAKSGSLVSNSSGLYPCKYREIENPWGSIYEFIDGVNINERQAWVCRTPADYASNVFAAPYEQLSYVNGSVDGYSIAMGFDVAHPFAEFPITVGGGGTTYYSDYYYQAIGQRIALLGGFWALGTAAGLSCWLLAFASSATGIIFGARLIKGG